MMCFRSLGEPESVAGGPDVTENQGGGLRGTADEKGSRREAKVVIVNMQQGA